MQLLPVDKLILAATVICFLTMVVGNATRLNVHKCT